MNFFCVELILVFLLWVQMLWTHSLSKDGSHPSVTCQEAAGQPRSSLCSLKENGKQRLGTHFVTSLKCWMSGSLDEELRSSSYFSYLEHLCADVMWGRCQCFLICRKHQIRRILLLPPMAFVLPPSAVIRILAESACGQWRLNSISAASRHGRTATRRRMPVWSSPSKSVCLFVQ